MFEKQMHLVSSKLILRWLRCFKSEILYCSSVISSTCIFFCSDCSKMNKLGVSPNVDKFATFRRNILKHFTDYELELYFVIFNPEIKNQNLTIFCLDSLTKHLNYTLCPHELLMHFMINEPCNRLKHVVLVSLVLYLLQLRKIRTLESCILATRSPEETIGYMK